MNTLMLEDGDHYVNIPSSFAIVVHKEDVHQWNSRTPEGVSNPTKRLKQAEYSEVQAQTTIRTCACA